MSFRVGDYVQHKLTPGVKILVVEAQASFYRCRYINTLGEYRADYFEPSEVEAYQKEAHPLHPLAEMMKTRIDTLRKTCNHTESKQESPSPVYAIGKQPGRYEYGPRASLDRLLLLTGGEGESIYEIDGEGEAEAIFVWDSKNSEWETTQHPNAKVGAEVAVDFDGVF